MRYFPRRITLRLLNLGPGRVRQLRLAAANGADDAEQAAAHQHERGRLRDRRRIIEGHAEIIKNEVIVLKFADFVPDHEDCQRGTVGEPRGGEIFPDPRDSRGMGPDDDVVDQECQDSDVIRGVVRPRRRCSTVEAVMPRSCRW